MASFEVSAASPLLMSTRGKVLVVDDDTVVLRITRARLESAGFSVVTRDKALGTTQAIINEKPDVILLDLDMPALRGDLLAELLEKNLRTKDVPIIFHSNEDLFALQQKARDAQAIGAIAKTGDDAVFLAQFERLFIRSMRKATP